jgi:hypothetical protein
MIGLFPCGDLVVVALRVLLYLDVALWLVEVAGGLLLRRDTLAAS